MELGLAGRAAIVTGASRGIGRAIAERLAAEGCWVLLVARDAAVLAEAATSIEGSVGFAADVTAPGSAEAVVAACLEAFGRLDVLVNNAGGATPARLEKLSDDDWLAAFQLNFFSAVRMSAAAVPVMREAGWGRLVHVASVSGREPDPMFAPYSAAKAALLNFSTSLSQAYAADGVLSSCVIPGITMTELVAANAEGAATRTGATADEVMATMLERHRVAAGRFGESDEIADAVAFLASERAAWITGATLEVDGGTLRGS